MEGIKKERIKCVITAFDTFVKSYPQALIAFDSDAAADFGGEWLKTDEYTVVSNSKYDHKRICDPFEKTTSYYLYRWTDIRADINRILSAPR